MPNHMMTKSNDLKDGGNFISINTSAYTIFNISMCIDTCAWPSLETKWYYIATVVEVPVLTLSRAHLTKGFFVPHLFEL